MSDDDLAAAIGVDAIRSGVLEAGVAGPGGVYDNALIAPPLEQH